MTPSLPPHCTPTSAFLVDLSAYFHVCIPTPLALLSTTLGTLSIVAWLFAQLPQIYTNYRLRSTAGLSMYFLIEWCLADMANFLGALFTHQAAWQAGVAAYYCFVDVCLFWQYFLYTYVRRGLDDRSLHSSNSSDPGDTDDDSINGLSPINSHFRNEHLTPVMSENSKPKDFPPALPISSPKNPRICQEKNPSAYVTQGSATSWLPSPSPRTLGYFSTSLALLSRANATPTPSSSSLLALAVHSTLVASETRLEFAGRIFSWSATVLYLGSRLPQLYHNFIRKSTAGLSPLLFIAAFCGNLCYSSSLLTNPNAWSDFPAYGGHGWAGPAGSDRWQWVGRATPFWLGAAGVLVMDAMMGVQFYLYGERGVEKIVKVRDARGRSRWERVSGWMRGWVPSVKGKEKVVDLRESQRLLRASGELERSRYGSLEHGIK